jgi:hypothetical protein
MEGQLELIIEGQLENYKLRLIDGKRIERFWKANAEKPDRWKELKKKSNGQGHYQIEFYFTKKKKRYIYYHRLIYWFYNQNWNILDGSKNNKIKHKDNIENNSIENLECVSQQQPCLNKVIYKATINSDCLKINLGSFKTKEEAHNAYLNYKLIFHQ